MSLPPRPSPAQSSPPSPPPLLYQTSPSIPPSPAPASSAPGNNTRARSPPYPVASHSPPARQSPSQRIHLPTSQPIQSSPRETFFTILQSQVHSFIVCRYIIPG